MATIEITAPLRKAAHEAEDRALLRAMGCTVRRCLLCLDNEYGGAVPCTHKILEAANYMKRMKVPFTKYEKDVLSDAELDKKEEGSDSWCTCGRKKKKAKKKRNKVTTAIRLDAANKDSEEDFIKAKGVKVSNKGREKNKPWYRFPDGSAVWLCDNCKHPFFDWGMGCCLPD